MAEQKKQPEVLIPENKIVETFQAFGYKPDEFDLAYWTRKPIDKYDDMLEKLSKRKEQERENQKEQKVQQIKNDGMGGTDTSTSTLDNDIFRGKYTLVQFTEDPDDSGPASTSTIWLIDTQSKKIIPFLSETAFNNAMTMPLKDVASKGLIKKISLSQLGSYKMLPDSQGIKDDGTIPTFEATVDDGKTSQRYGKNVDAKARDVLNEQFPGFIKLLKSDPNSGVSTATLDEVLNDPSQVAFYVNALTYGDYQLSDIFRDLKRKELVKQGNNNLKNVTVIDASQPANQFYSTPIGQSVKTNVDLTLPDYLADIDTDMFNYSVFNLPDEVYKVLVPPLDWTTPEGQAEIDNIKSAYHDVLMEQLQATTDQSKSLADYNWQTFKDGLEKKYGIALSDNATQAWGQLDTLGKTYTGRGLTNSGLFEEAKDKYLQDIRRADEKLRQSKIDEKDTTEAEYLRKSGTPEQVQAFLNSIADETTKDELKKYFQPSDEIKNWFSKENLKTLYPDLSDEELDQYSSSIIDPTTGLYRSELQQQLFQNKLKITQDKKLYQIGDVSVDTTTGAITGGYGATYNKALAEEKAYKEYTNAQPFEKAVTTPTETSTTATTPTSTSTTSTWTAPSGYEKVSGPSQLTNYNNIISEPGTINKWGMKKITTPTSTPTPPALGEYVSNPEYLKNYKESDIIRQNGKIYLKPGIIKKW